MDWYTRHFNIYPSDILYIPEEKVDPATGEAGRKQVALFGSIDRGQEPVDHHTFFMTTTDARQGEPRPPRVVRGA